MRCGKLGSSKSSRRGRRRIGKEKQKTVPHQCSSTQVSVQRTDANLGHQQLWLFWVAPLIGGALGGGNYRALFSEG
jgi:hypothetical protein